MPDPGLIAAAAPNIQSIFSAYGKLGPNTSILRSFNRNQLAELGQDPCAGSSTNRRMHGLQSERTDVRPGQLWRTQQLRRRNPQNA